MFAISARLGDGVERGLMSFASLEYAALLLVVFFSYWALARAHVARAILLVAAGMFFYASWNAKYLALLLVPTTVDYFVALGIAGTDDPRRRKLLLALSIVAGLGTLCVFKYFDFFVDSIVGGASGLGLQLPRPHLRLLLPVGISFFTFETISYSIDVYRRTIQPTRNYLHFLLFVSFFPHLVAGPIVRASHFLPQLERTPTLTPEQGGEGLFLICVGLIKKVCIADFLATNLVDRVFDFPERFSSLEVLTSLYGYSVQIYCDFSGYSDIAIGSALLLGLRLPQNFDAPYLSRGVLEFWRRWHITLSNWLRDYLYAPLAGSRPQPRRIFASLFLTMLLAGLWHGAAWTFVFWGGLHGAMMVAERALQMRWPPVRNPSTLRVVVGVLLTFHFLSLSWIFFRARSWSVALQMLRQLGELDLGSANLHRPALLVLAIGLASHALPDRWFRQVQGSFARLPALAGAAAVLGVLALVSALAQQEAAPFIYFQF